MKKMIALLCALVLMLSCASVAGAEEALNIVNTTAIVETLDYGARVTGLLIELSDEISTTQVVAATYAGGATFAVEGREVGQVFVCDEDYERALAQGKYVYVQLVVPVSPVSTVGAYSVGTPVELTVTQVTDIVSVNGAVLPAGQFTNTATKFEIVDDFLPLSYVDEETGIELFYRLYIPEGYDAKSADLANLPLVTFLHGGGEGGTDNELPVTANDSAIEWAKPEAQAKHPCFVLAPQSPTGSWSKSVGTEEAPSYVSGNDGEIVIKIINQLVEEYNIDANRLYCTGLSYGGRGTCAANCTYPDLFAAAIVVASCDIYSEENLANLIDKPIWVLLGADDSEERNTNTALLVDRLESLGATVCRYTDDETMFDGYLRGEAAAAMAQEQIDAAEAMGANVLYTKYLPNTTIPNSHFSWIAVYQNEAIRDWMFSQVNG